MSLKVTLLEGSNYEEDQVAQRNGLDERNCGSPLREDSIEASRINNHYLRLEPLHKVNHPNAPVYFFDLDNTLYPKSSGIDKLMAERIELYFINYLKLPHAESKQLGARFYRDYGLAIKGLIKHFSIDPREYDRFVDGGLPLDEILKPQLRLQSLIDRLSQKGHCWIFTNAGLPHALRVLSLLQIKDYFSGVIYCDYSEENFPAKPDRMAFARAMQCVGIEDPKKCFFFDDSINNIRSAQEMGWNVVYIDEENAENFTHSSSAGSINASLQVINANVEGSADEPTFPTVKYIEEIENLFL